MITEVRNRWPALFEIGEVNLEFMRITTVPLISKFIGQLDKYTDGLMKVFRHKGGCAGQKIHIIMALTAKVSVFLCFAFFFQPVTHLTWQEFRNLSHTRTHTHTFSIPLRCQEHNLSYTFIWFISEDISVSFTHMHTVFLFLSIQIKELYCHYCLCTIFLKHYSYK